VYFLSTGDVTTSSLKRHGVEFWEADRFSRNKWICRIWRKIASLHKNTDVSNFLGNMGLVNVLTHSACKLHIKFALLRRLYLWNSHSVLTSPFQDVCPFMYRPSQPWLITVRAQCLMRTAELETRDYAIIRKVSLKILSKTLNLCKELCRHSDWTKYRLENREHCIDFWQG